jgi:type VII secretion integral membrane protein EccD
VRRVAVHAHNAWVDLALPATVAVAELIPPIVDTVGGETPGARYHLARVGGSALPGSTTLAQNGIRDGTALVLTRHTPAPPVVRHDDEADAVSAALSRSTGSWGRMTAALAAVFFTAAGDLALVRYAAVAPRADSAAAATAAVAVTALTTAVAILRVRHDAVAGLILSLIATTSAALAGLLAVPGDPGATSVLLAAMAAGVTAVLAIRLTGCGVVPLAATSCCAAVIGLAALTSILTAAPAYVVGSATALACLGLIEVTPWLSIRLAGLMPSVGPNDPRPDGELAAKALRAGNLLTILRAGFGASAAGTALTAAVVAPRAVALALVTGGVLILHARTDRARGPMFVITGVTTVTATLAVGAAGMPRQAPWFAVLATAAAAAAIYLGFVGPVVTPSARRGVQALGCIALTVVAPLTCWTCGAFGAVRGLNLLRL